MSQSSRALAAVPVVLPLLLACALTACQGGKVKKPIMGPGHIVSNFSRTEERLPEKLRVVAVLPLVIDQSPDDPGGARAESLSLVLQAELLKCGRFQPLLISSDTLRQWTGRRHWTASDALPSNFMEKIRSQAGCDGVLFCRLSQFRAYPPLVIGWNLQLVDVEKKQTIWAVDELFDASEPPVSTSARRYAREHPDGGPTLDTPIILTSPERFAHYTAWSVLETLPLR
jgi:hypothetical protein